MDDNERRPLSLEEAQSYLDEVALRLPAEVYQGLNGGVVLLPDVVPSPYGEGLYILGQYHYEPYGLGRYVTIHHGSLVRVHRGSTVAQQKKALDEVLRHELVHHVESLAGIRDLEYRDEVFLQPYKERKEKAEKDKKNKGKNKKDEQK